jgi:hypothetical protein
MSRPPGYIWIVHGVWRRGQLVPLETQGEETGDVLVAPFLSARTSWLRLSYPLSGVN